MVKKIEVYHSFIYFCNAIKLLLMSEKKGISPWLIILIGET